MTACCSACLLVHTCADQGRHLKTVMSSASTYSCSTSVAADDQSSISSSSSSQSDASYGGRLPYWVEPSARPHLSNEMASSSSTLRALGSSDDRLYAAVLGSPGSHPSSAQLHSRGLHDSGRQSSLDSGIGISAGSQLSHSGSFSSTTGSLDTASQEGGEEFGSVASLPAPPSSSHTMSPSSPPPPPPPSFQSPLSTELSSPTSTSCPCASRSGSRVSQRHSEDYQVPNLLRLRYETPRSLLQSMTEPPTQHGPPELCADRGGGQGQRLKDSLSGSERAERQAAMQRSHPGGSERAPSVDSEGRCTPRPLLLPKGWACDETQVTTHQ